METPIADNLMYPLKKEVDFGTVKIADDVVAMIASIAAMEVDGIHGMAGGAGQDILRRVGVKNQTRGARVSIDGKRVAVILSVIVDYGYSIPTVSQKAQERVKQTIESMTGLIVTDVDIRIAGVDLKAK